MDAQNHFGGPKDFAPIRMGRDKAKETVKAGHGGEGGGCLFRGESTGGQRSEVIKQAMIDGHDSS